MTEQLAAELGEKIASQILKQAGRHIDKDEPIISSGLIDSFSLVDVALLVEDTYGVRIADTELNAATFDTLSRARRVDQAKRRRRMTLGERLQLRWQRQPDQVAIYLQHAGQPDKRLRFADLWRGAQRFARSYRDRGLKPGDVAILILQHGEDLIFAFWGAIICGVIPSIMPFLTEKLSPEQYRNDLKALLSVTAPAALVTYPEFERAGPGGRRRHHPGAAADLNCARCMPWTRTLGLRMKSPCRTRTPLFSCNIPPAPPVCKKGLPCRTGQC